MKVDGVLHRLRPAPLVASPRASSSTASRRLPLGGYVKIAGMNPYEPVDPEDLPRTYGAKPIWQRALTIFAGPGSTSSWRRSCSPWWCSSTGIPQHGAGGRLGGRHGEPASAVGRKGGGPAAGRQGREGRQRREPHPGPAAYHHDEGGHGRSRTAARVHDRARRPTISRSASCRGSRSIPGSDQRIGRIGSCWAYEQRRPGHVRRRSACKLVGWSITESFREIGHVFGPAGDRAGLFSLLFTERQSDRRRSRQRHRDRPAGRRDVERGGLGRGTPGLRVRHRVHRPDQPGPAAAVRRRPPVRAADREGPRARRSTCAS